MSELLAQPAQTAADQRAGAIFQANRTALSARQPDVTTALEQAAIPAGLNWVFGRDGSLTARTGDGAWWAGSSLPLGVGRALIKSLEMAGSVGCFLSPTTAGQIRAALEKIDRNQALIVVLPDSASAAVALHCEAFDSEITGGRLGFVVGADWPRQLTRLLESNPGLCVPEQYIRTGLIAEIDVSSMASLANPIFTAEISRRTEMAADLRRRWKPGGEKICVVAGSRFQLWNLAGTALARTFADGEKFLRIDNDRPLSASPLAMAIAAEECSAILAADLYRADLPGVLPDGIPWITWATRPRFRKPGTERDAVILADESWRSAARAAGWNEKRIAIAAWPALLHPNQSGRNLAIIADATIADVDRLPKNVRDLSSLSLLWNSIAEELGNDPMALGNDWLEYLSTRAEQLHIAAAALDKDLFQTQLILPAWIGGVARLLKNSGLPVAVFGNGWDRLMDLEGCWGGVVASMDDLNRAARAAAAIVHPIPTAPAHPVLGLGQPVLSVPKSAEKLLRQAKNALAGGAVVQARKALSEELIRSLLD